MPSITRRNTLQFSGAFLALGVAGCTEISPDSSEASRLAGLHVGNYDRESYIVHVLLVEDGEPAYWDKMEIEPVDEHRLGGGNFDGYPTDPGNYVLYVWRDDQSRSEWTQVDFDNHDRSCLDLTILIGMRGTSAGEITITSTTRCPDEQSDNSDDS